jgi:parvulin-like peptidyl-prolyl isomerase
MYQKLGFVVLATLSIGIAPVATAQGRPDEIAVVVNGEPVSTWEIRLLFPQIQGELAAQGLDTKGDMVIRAALQRAIDNRLLAQEATRLGIQPNEQRVNERLSEMAERAGGRAKLEAELITTGITYEQLRATVVQADLVQSLVESEVVSHIQVTDAEIAAFYDENLDLFKQPDKIHCRHILFKAGPDASPAEREAARANAVAAHERAVAGEDFAGLAVELSEGPNALKGGDLGFTTRGQMVESFDEAVWGLAPGEISDVVETELGYHVIKVEEIVTGKTVPLEEARPVIEDLLRQQKTGDGIGVLVVELRKKAEIRDPESGE